MTADTLAEKHRPARILLVEDNKGDVLLTKRAFKEGRFANEIIVARTGEEALMHLRKEGEYSGSKAPDIILLDLNLPQMSGQDVLKIIKDDPQLKHIPVVILSSSKANQDVVKSYSLHANGYIVKPVSLESFTEVVKKIEQFWFTVVVMPEPDLSKVL